MKSLKENVCFGRNNFVSFFRVKELEKNENVVVGDPKSIFIKNTKK